jgi:hypothetical protein
MAVLVTANVPGQTQAGYDGMLSALTGPLREATGFIAHWAHPVDGGWRIMELWETADDATAFFAKFVQPNLPPGIKPKRSIQDLHSLVRP